MIFCCGLILHWSYAASGGAVWSVLVSGVNDSPWETIKSFVIVYGAWFFIELSYLRPSLLHFTASKIIAMHLFIFIGCGLILAVRIFTFNEAADLIMVLISAAVSMLLSSKLYASRIRTELFIVPLLISLALTVGCVLFCTFFPPPLVIFR